VRPDDLAADAIKAVCPVPPKVDPEIADVYFGCATRPERTMQHRRMAALLAGLPDRSGLHGEPALASGLER